MDRQQEYTVIFGNSARAIIASMVAYLTAQFVDVQLFHFWKRLTNGRHLWLRNNASTMISQMIDTVLVVTILFYGQLPFAQIQSIICASYLFKLIIAASDTPFFYLGSRYLQLIQTNSRCWPARPTIIADLLLFCGSLADITLFIVGVLLASSGQANVNLGIILLIIASISHLIITLNCACPHQHRIWGFLITCAGLFSAIGSLNIDALLPIHQMTSLVASLILVFAGLWHLLVSQDTANP